MRVAVRMKVQDLDEFIKQSDLLGGPGAVACEEYWLGREYDTSIFIDDTIDPFSEEYVALQIAVYEEISGRTFNQEVNEHSTIDVETHVAATNPYNHPSPSGLAMHIERLSRLLHHAGLPRDGDLLDMGCGWGLSSEVAAYCGLNVLAVDINLDFVRLVETRARQRNFTISAVQGTFDGFTTDRRFDGVLFYECFHHALRPWTVMASMGSMLKAGGKIMLAGEPINEIWWKHWGLRLDPMSIYCIRKFGWFESGWSESFLHKAFFREGFACRFIGGPDDETGYTVVAARVAQAIMLDAQATMTSAIVNERCVPTGWSADEGYLTSFGDSTLRFVLPEGAGGVRLDLTCFRRLPLPVKIWANGELEIDAEMTTGPHSFDFERGVNPYLDIQIKSTVWCPHDELRNGDGRRIGIHLCSVTIL